MNDERILEDLERRVARSLHATAPHAAPDLADRLLRRTAAEPQGRRWGGLGLLPALAAAAAVVLIAIVVGLQLGNLLPRSEPPAVGSSGDSIDPSPSATPPAEPTLVPTSEPSGSAEPLPEGSECTNQEFGFTVRYPAEWWANDEIAAPDPVVAPIPACTYFAEEPVDLQPATDVPPAVSIIVDVEEGPPPGAPVDYEVISSEQTRVDGLDATIQEIEWPTDTIFIPAGTRSYGYHVEMPNGETIVIATSSTATLGDYADHKRVLDEMMETFEAGS